MADKKRQGLPPETGSEDERALWEALGDVAREEPSPELRRRFYRELERASRPRPLERLQGWLGFSGTPGWITAAACLLVGIGSGQLIGGSAPAADDRLAALEESVTRLNRRLVLDRLENDTPAKRLRGVIDAGTMAANDAEVARALLERATRDRIPSVRAAAIDALGPRVQAPAIGDTLMTQLGQAASPIVQLALVDLLLRYGSDAQLERLLALAEDGALHPDLGRHVLSSLKGDVV